MIKKDLKKYSKIFEQKDRLSQSKASKVWPVFIFNTQFWAALKGMFNISDSFGRVCFFLAVCFNLRWACVCLGVGAGGQAQGHDGRLPPLQGGSKQGLPGTEEHPAVTQRRWDCSEPFPLPPFYWETLLILSRVLQVWIPMNWTVM